MPHDVIMPALGMAQDSGLIIAWLKQAGDAVKTGDALMEVETDKAVMEVEAPADGFLTNVRAAAGENVPVGQVIAVINDIADAPVADREASEAKPKAPVMAPEGQSVIMPALGMTQDTGLIIAWHKSPGEAVAVDDVLFDVETDKATMEVAAGHDGFVAALLAQAGDEVPVGDVVAVISASKPDAPISRSASAPVAARSAPVEPKQDLTADAPETAAAAPPQPGPVQLSNGRILASPKSRRLALEQGLDLSRLVAAGHPPPYHVKDLQVLRDLPVPSAPTTAPTQSRRVTARVSAGPFNGFLAWCRTENASDAPEPSQLLAAFATGALRTAHDAAGPIRVQLETLRDEGCQIVDADRLMAQGQFEDSLEAPDLILRDMTGSAITSLDLGPSYALVIGIVTNGEAYEITLDFCATQLSDQTAIALITGVADRLSDPLRQLL